MLGSWKSPVVRNEVLGCRAEVGKLCNGMLSGTHCVSGSPAHTVNHTISGQAFLRSLSKGCRMITIPGTEPD